MIIRPILPAEAHKLWQLLNQIDNETKFMMYEPGERPKNLTGIEAMTADKNNLFLVAENEENQDFAGFISAERGAFNRNRHSAYLVVGIKSAYQHQGVGTQLFQRLSEWAEAQGVVRLELTVMAPNLAAQALYKKFGFKVEGLKEKSLKVDGHYVDEFYMAKIIGENEEGGKAQL